MKLTTRDKAILRMCAPARLADVRGILRQLRGGCFYAECKVKAPHDH